MAVVTIVAAGRLATGHRPAAKRQRAKRRYLAVKKPRHATVVAALRATAVVRTVAVTTDGAAGCSGVIGTVAAAAATADVVAAVAVGAMAVVEAAR